MTALDTLRSIALGLCVLCAAGGVIQIFWPENGYKPVINTVLVLYIVTSVLQMRGTAGGRLPQIQWDALQPEAGIADYQAYADRLAQESSAAALGSLLVDAGIEAEVTLSDGVCRVLLADAADEPRARSILDANCGTLPCEIETGGDAP